MLQAYLAASSFGVSDSRRNAGTDCYPPTPWEGIYRERACAREEKLAG